MARYKDPRYFLLGTVPTIDDKKIATGKLPTNKQILLSFIARKEELTTKAGKYLRDAAKDTIQEVLPIYEKADIKMKAKNKCEDDVLKLYKDMMSLVSIQMKQRNDPKSLQRIEDFKEKICKTMPLWGRNSTATEEDEAFVENMSTTRTATMAGRDTKTQITAANKAKRKSEDQHREEREKARRTIDRPVNDIDEPGTGAEIQEAEDIEAEVEPNIERKHHRSVKTGQNLFIPPDVLSLPTLNSCAARNKISPTVLASLTSSLISGCGGDPNKFNLSYGYSYRYENNIHLCANYLTVCGISNASDMARTNVSDLQFYQNCSLWNQ